MKKSRGDQSKAFDVRAMLENTYNEEVYDYLADSKLR
jgi:hypothetical protein